MAVGDQLVSTVVKYLQDRPNATDADIAAAMDFFNVPAEVVARATNLDTQTVMDRYQAASGTDTAYNVAQDLKSGQISQDEGQARLNSIVGLPKPTEFDPSAPITREGLESLYINLLGRTPGDEALEYWLGQDVNPNINASENPTDLTTFGEIESAISDAAQPEFVNRQESLVPGVAEPTTTQEFASLVAAGQNPYQEGSARYNVMDYFIRNPQATDAQIAAAMSFADVSPQLVADVTAVPIEDVISRYDIQRRASVLGEGVPTTPTTPTTPGQPTVPGQGPGGAGYTPGGFQYTPFDYTNMAAPPEGAVPSIFSVGGVFGPGQGMPQVPQVPGVDTGLGTPSAQPGTGTTAPGSRTLVSPGITTYAYPQAFGNIDIFDRPGVQAPTPFTPPPASSTNTTTQQDMTGTIGDRLGNLSPAQQALLGSIFG